jgi:predicted NAD/FAD-binding protein
MVERIAVIGSGVSGLGAAWLLATDPRKRYHVTLYEKNDYVGGHTHTVDYTPPNKKELSVPVDTGFIVFNELTYPNFLQFLDRIGVKHILSDMSFAVSRDRGRFEWAGTDLGTVFAQRSNLISFRFWRTLLDILRFNHLATDILADSKDGKAVVEDSMSIGEYLKVHGYSQSFAEDYLLPMTAAIWSTPADKCWQDFPAVTLIRFMHNHCLLQIFDRPVWRTIDGGS